MVSQMFNAFARSSSSFIFFSLRRKRFADCGSLLFLSSTVSPHAEKLTWLHRQDRVRSIERQPVICNVVEGPYLWKATTYEGVVEWLRKGVAWTGRLC